MICHDHKIIFIHIPRTGGTSIEKLFFGKDWWNIDPSTKHIFASTAKEFYKDYWEEYFKFTILRNPWERMISLAKYPHIYGIKIKNGKLDLTEYIRTFNDMEVDPRSLSYYLQPLRRGNGVYSNILNESLDKIFNFSKFEDEIGDFAKNLGIFKKIPHAEKRHNKKNWQEYYTDETYEQVSKLYADDFDIYKLW